MKTLCLDHAEKIPFTPMRKRSCFAPRFRKECRVFPDLILLDMCMKDMSGPEFLKVLEEKLPRIFKNVPIVFLTGMAKAPISKAAGFIRKPIDLKKLLAIEGFVSRGANQETLRH